MSRRVVVLGAAVVATWLVAAALILELREQRLSWLVQTEAAQLDCQARCQGWAHTYGITGFQPDGYDCTCIGEVDLLACPADTYVAR